MKNASKWLLLLALCLVLGGCGSMPTLTGSAVPELAEDTHVTATAASTSSNHADKEDYAAVFTAYQDAYAANFTLYDGDYITDVSELLHLPAEQVKLYYALTDLNGSDTPALLIGASQEENGNIVIYGVWGYDGKAPCKLVSDYSLGYRNLCYLCKNGILKFEWSSGALQSGVSYYTVAKDGSSLEQKEAISITGDPTTQVVRYYHSDTPDDNSAIISEAEYEKIKKSYEEITPSWEPFSRK